MLMKYEEYLELDETSQIIELQNAVSLLRKEHTDYTKVVFQLHAFYVEITQEGNKIKMFPFDSTQFLDPYLEQVDISFVDQLVKLQ